MKKRMLFLQLVVSARGGRVSMTDLASAIYGEATHETKNRLASLKYLAARSHPHIRIGSTPSPGSKGGDGYYWWENKRGLERTGRSRVLEGGKGLRSKNRERIAKRRNLGRDERQDDSGELEDRPKAKRKHPRVSKADRYSVL